MAPLKYGVTDPEDFDRAFGKHQNIRECCTERRILTGEFGPCKRCQLRGDFLTRLHRCSPGEAECKPFLSYIHSRTLERDEENMKSDDDFEKMWIWKNNSTHEQLTQRVIMFAIYGYAVEKTDAVDPHDAENEQYYVFRPKEGKLLQFRRPDQV